MFDTADPGEGFILQRLSADRAAVFWFTFDDQGAQRWMTGVGMDDEGEWLFDDLTITEGGRFGADFDPSEVDRRAWDGLSLRLDCRAGAADYASQIDGFSSGQQSLARLTFLAGQSC